MARPPIAVALVTLGGLVGVHHNTLGLWCQEGMPHQRQGKTTRVDLGGALHWLMAKHAKALTQARTRASSKAMSAKEAKLTAEARLKELDLEERRGALVSADAVRDRLVGEYSALREGVLQISGGAVQAGIIAPAAQAALDELCRAALSTLGRNGEPPDVEMQGQLDQDADQDADAQDRA